MKYVHIAGTNGKGSVAEYISSIFTAAGVRCGCYTSPHLVSHTERMRIGSEHIGDEELCSLLDEVKEKRLAVNETLFAAYTAAALLWFERRDADIAVIETGLGGRLDPTNIIQPSVVVLTSIDYDHMELLGDTIEKIAEEKCGIIKPGVPVVSAAQCEDAVNVISSHCKRKNAPLRFARPAEILSSGHVGQTFSFEGDEYFISAIGSGQPDNAALATLAAKQMGIGSESIKSGLAAAKLKCRAQYITGSPDILLDGAHNEAAITSLLKTLELHFGGRKKVLLFACMKDKDYAAIIKSLKGVFESVVVTLADEARGADPHTLCRVFSDFVMCTAERDIRAAFETARKEAAEQDAMLVVCGSFYLAGKILEIFQAIEKLT